MIITIDGPAKSGKSRAAELLAAKLGFAYLNTGAMYRAAGLAFRESGWLQEVADIRQAASIQQFVDTIHFEMTERVVLNGKDVTDQIQTLDAGNAASVIGTYKPLREKLKAEQRRIAAGRDIICEGRDQGTSVFPHAEIKFYVTASPAVRAERMAKTMPGTPDLIALAAEIATRDERDSTRTFDPLKPATDAIAIDTSNLSAERVVEFMNGVVDKWRSKG